MIHPFLFRPCRWLLLLTSIALGGCGLFGTVPEPAPVEEAVLPAPVAVPAPPPRDEGAALRAHLREHYKLWKGTPYRLGGLTTRGIDCSGFVLVTFKALLGTTLPRTVEAQAQLGQGIGPEQLETGDLVFFRTGGATRHVGIYLEQGRFLHASTRRGVMISRLGDGYWRHRYWQARRVRPAPPTPPTPAVQSAGND